MLYSMSIVANNQFDIINVSLTKSAFCYNFESRGPMTYRFDYLT